MDTQPLREDSPRFFSNEPIIGWRLWWNIDNNLYSLVDPNPGFTFYDIPKTSWLEEWQQANCGSFLDHEVPAVDCFCGFWAMKDVPSDGYLVFAINCYIQSLEGKLSKHLDFAMPLNTQLVIGKVEMKGKVIEGARGYRSEYARPILETVREVTTLDLYAISL